ncbi:MAG: CHAT domain-containing tetratricopeptide repeat protein [Chitinophagaceae bacterium]
MRPLLVSVLLFFSLMLSAQQSFPLVQQVMDLFNKGEYAKAIPLAEKAVETTRTELGEKSPFHSGMVLFLAISHMSLFHFSEAEKWMEKHNELTLKYTGEKTQDYIAGLNRIAYLKREMGKYPEAEAAYQKAMDISRALTGENDTAYAKSLNNLGSLYQFIGQYGKAENTFIQARDLLKKLTGESPLYASTVNNLATLYSEEGEYEKAKTLSLQVLALRKKVPGENHPDYAQALNNLGYVFAALGQTKEAEQYYSAAAETYKRTLGEDHPDYASSINNLAELYLTIGEYSQSEALYVQAKEIRKRTLGEDHPDYSQSLNNLAAFYETAGQYDTAEKLLLESKERTARSPGEDHPYYVTALNNLAALYQTLGQYVKAEPLYQQAKEIRKKLLGENHPSYALSLNNLATLYHETGQYAKAIPLYLQAAEIWKRSLGTRHYYYAMVLNNLAAVYEDQKLYAKAEPLYLEARDIRKAVFGENHNDYATSLNNLAGLYANIGQYTRAESLVLQANAIWKRIVKDDNPMIALGMNNLAAIYRKGQLKLKEAEQLYLQAIERRKQQLGENHPLTAETENDLALLYMNLKQFKKAEPLLLTSSRVTTQHLLNTFPVLSEKEKGDFINENLFFNECNNSFLYNNPGASAAVINNNLNLLLFFKSLSLADTRNMLEAIRNSHDTALQRMIAGWQSVKSTLAAQYALPVEKRMKDLAEKEAQAENLEKELNRRSAVFRQQQSTLRVTLQEVQQQLEEDEAAVEFVSFSYYNKRKTDSVIYAAYILRKHDTVASFVPLFEEKQLQALIDRAGRQPTLAAKSFYGTNANVPTAAGNELYHLAWEPLEKHLAGIRKISYSPSGKLYGIAFQALPVSPGKLLQDQYELRQYVSTRQIAFRSAGPPKEIPGSIALFGNASFTLDSAALVKLSAGNRQEKDPARRGGTGGWPALPYTGAEVDTIKKIFDHRHIRSLIYTKEEASETNVKLLNNHSPSVIHIATHGFYVSEAASQKADNTGRGGGGGYKLANDPLLRNGLILAGGNDAWGGNIPLNGADDGILTAYEIAQLNLAATRLLVLSACETALGDIKGSEGVFGLQRGFKMAGAGQMILSLWQVPDKETSLLMEKFYSYWLNGETIRHAFYRAQAEMRNEYPPFSWAAFVLVE